MKKVIFILVSVILLVACSSSEVKTSSSDSAVVKPIDSVKVISDTAVVDSLKK
jgi:uncharacterized protein YcfL